MREILFRGKRIDNGELIVGHLLWYEDGRARITPRHIDIYCLADDDNTIQHIAFEVIPETVGQYTGLTDKNGTKIFEGDIVRYPDTTMFPSSEETINEGFVDWDEETMCFYFTNRLVVDMEDFYIDKGKMVDVEVIGNIHDNPELLEGGAE